MFKNLFLLFKNINLSINILGCLIIKYLYNFSFGMQFSRYILVKAFCLNIEIWSFELQHLSSSPKEYWCNLYFTKIQASLRSMRCAIFLNSNFALLVLIKCFCGNTIASLRYARCTFSLRFKLRFARFHQVKNAAASTYSPIPSPV